MIPDASFIDRESESDHSITVEIMKLGEIMITRRSCNDSVEV